MSNATVATSLATLLFNVTLQPNVSSLRNSSDSKWRYLPLQPKQGLILFLITLPGTVANVVAFLTTLKLLRKQRTSNAANYLVLALTATDFYGIVFCTLPTLLCYLKKEWIGGMEMCNFQGVSTMFASLASGSLATSMAVERMFAVWKPFTYRKTASLMKTASIIATILVSAFVIAVIPLSRSGNFVRNLTGTFCTINWFAKNKDNIAYAIFYVFLGISLLVVNVVCNVKLAMCLLVTSKKRALLRGNLTEKKLMKEDSDVGDRIKTKSSSNVNERQLAKTVILISLLFLICWVPFMIRIICNLTGLWVDAWADVQVSRLLLLNFVLDPFLYTLSRKQCRDIVKGWLCCCCPNNGTQSTLSSRFLRKRKKHGSFLTSSQTGSASPHTNVSSIAMGRIKSASTATSPAQSKENLASDPVVHLSESQSSDAAKNDPSAQKAEARGKAIQPETSENVSDTRSKTDEKSLQRHYSTSAAEAKAHCKDVTKSVPDLTEAVAEAKNEEIKVDVAFMYDLAFQRQNSDQPESDSTKL